MSGSARIVAGQVDRWLRGELGAEWEDIAFEADESHDGGEDVVLVGALTARGAPGEASMDARVGLRLTVRGAQVAAGEVHSNPAEALRAAGLAETTGRDVAIVRRHYEAFNRDDLDGVAATLHPEVELFGGDERGGAGERFSGRDDVRGFFAEIKQLVADNETEILSLEATPGRVEASVRLRGTLRDEGLSGELPAMHFFTIRDGLIARIETFRPQWRPV